MAIILGVDAGGTKTDLAAADGTGKILGVVRTGSSNYISEGIRNAQHNLLSGIRHLIKECPGLKEGIVFDSACFGFAGNNSAADQDRIENIIYGSDISSYLKKEKTLILNDTRIGLAAGTDNENAVIVICGTGSNCYGINQEGKEAKANGWDYILGDQGSGYAMGLKALQAVMKDHDGRGEKTSLKKGILLRLGVDIEGLIKWTYEGEFSKAKIADLSIEVCDQAAKGDKVSRRIMKEEASEVILNIETVVKKLDIKYKDFDIVFLGGNFKCQDWFKSIIDKRLVKDYRKAKLVELDKKPVEGAIRLALKYL